MILFVCFLFHMLILSFNKKVDVILLSDKTFFNEIYFEYFLFLEIPIN